MHYKSLCRVMVAAMSLSLVIPNVSMAAEPTTAASENVTEAHSQPVTDPETEPSSPETNPSETTPSESNKPSETPTEPTTPTESESQPNTKPETEPPSESETPSTGETGDGTNGSESNSQDGSEDTEKPTESETEDLHKQPQILGTEEEESETKKQTESNDQTESNNNNVTNNSQYGSNQELVANQQIVIPPQILSSFRFVTVKKVYALSKQKNLKVYSDKDTSSTVVGKLPKNGLCYVLQSEDEEWTYIESGSVRGFVKADKLTTGKKANNYVKKKTEKKLQKATALVNPLENPALTFTKTTTNTTVVKKRYAIAKTEGLNIREGKSEESRILGKLPKGALCYVLKDAKKEWVYVESGDVRGFVSSKLLIQGKEAEKLVEETGEDEIALADELIDAEDNEVLYYTLTSTKEGAISSSIRDSMVRFAQQFVGNAYVWGGVSLTNGADCSGFVQSIYAQYGYSLPRVAEDQAQYGMKIPVEEAAPGDLIFYAKDGYIHHVVMYIGDGKTVEAQSTATGIVNANVNEGEAVWATRIISDDDVANVELVSNNTGQYTSASDSDIGQLLGTFKLTAYCSCPICCGQWSGGPTASGAMPIQGRTVAMAGVPFGTRLVINGQIYTVEDRGTPYGHVDIYLNNHQEAVNFGVQYTNVYMAN